MKNKFLVKLIAFLLLMTMMASIGSIEPVAYTTAATNTTVTTQKNTQKTFNTNNKNINKNLKNTGKEEKSWFDKNGEDTIKSTTSLFSNIIDIAKGENANAKNAAIDVTFGVVNLVASCFGLGGISSTITGFLGGIFKDDEPKEPTEIEKLQEHIDNQFDVVNEGIDEIRNDISDLSNEMNDRIDGATNEIISVVGEEIRASTAGQKVYNFTSSAEGNFDYTMFKNYLYGVSDSSNPYSRYAYVDKLAKANKNGATKYEIELYYNDIYRALTTEGSERMPYIEILRQYIMDDEFGYSIQRYYYDWLLQNQEIIENSGIDAEWIAICFAKDLYQTLVTAESYLALTYQYFLVKMYENNEWDTINTAYYRFESPQGYVTYLSYADIVNQIEFLTNKERYKDLRVQIAKDVTYILNAENSYNIKDISGCSYERIPEEKEIFKQVGVGQTIYINTFSSEINDYLNLDPQDFTVEWSTGDINDGCLVVPNGLSELSATLKLYGKKIYSINFDINNGTAFNGGMGTEENPYLISDASQFNLITFGEKGRNIHYKLINDIDFKNATIDPFGSEDNAFEGVLDGNGHLLKNIKLNVKVNTGIFVKISKYGEINNLIVDNLNTNGSFSGNNDIYAGTITSSSEGLINNCHIINSNLSVNRDTSNKDSNMNIYVGGIVAKNLGTISNCSVKNTKIIGNSKLNYGDADEDKNKNGVWCGGIVGFAYRNCKINNCVVFNGTTIKATATSICNKDKWWLFGWWGGEISPYVSTCVGGITSLTEAYGDLHPEMKNVFVEDGVELTADSSCDNTGSRGENSNNFYEDQDAYVTCQHMIYVDHDDLPYLLEKALNSNGVIQNLKQYNVTYSYSGAFNNEYNCYESQLYGYNEDFLNTDNLKLFANGTEIKNYTILGVYGLDTLSSTKNSVANKNVTVLFETEIDGKTQKLSVAIPITVKEIKPVKLTIKKSPKVDYVKGETLNIAGGVYELLWEDGSTEEVTPTISSGSTNSYGKSNVELSYNGVSDSYTIVVACVHNYQTSVIAPTCQSVGYTKDVCLQCNAVIEYNFVDKLPHTIDVKGAITATCVVDGYGYTGDKYCTVCNEVLERGETINVIQHTYQALDGNSCKCIACDADSTTKPHDYFSVENSKTIIYTCATCGYSYTVNKKVNEDITKVVVGDSYGIVGSDNNVIVYVKMFNNPGITGVSFRIEYDERLKYVSFERGDLLLQASEFQIAQANGVIGFVAASPDETAKDGNLLKLVFKLPKDAKVMDKYDISIAYTRKQFTEGHGDAIDIITLNGSITAVTHLPGDVNNDNCVDILDTALIARYLAVKNASDATLLEDFLVSQNYNFSEFYADVNLDGEVDLSDLVIMLQYFVGKNFYELVSNEFEVILNPNNGTSNLSSIVVKCYDENGNRGVYPTLPIPTREGYRFDGWYLSLDVTDLTKNKVNSGDLVYFNTKLEKQTLYAHWTEVFTIKYDANAPDGNVVVGEMEDDLFVYGEDRILSLNEYSIVGWDFKGWSKTANGAVDYLNGAEFTEMVGAGETITLYAIWEARTYTVKFKENKPSNASGNLNWDMDSIICVYGTEYTLPLQENQLLGWTFKGWSTTATGTVEYVNGQNILNLTGESNKVINFYAVWEANKYTVKFNANKPAKALQDVSGEMTSLNCVYDADYELPANAYTLVGWTFKGWSKTETGKVAYADSIEFRNLSAVDKEEINLYAVWEANKYTIKFNANKPSNASASVNGQLEDLPCTYDVNCELPSNVYTLTGWTFKGWSTSATGTVEYANGQNILNLTGESNKVINFYAVWEANKVTVVYNANGGEGEMEASTYYYDAPEGTLTENTFSKSGYAFLCWNTKVDGSGINYANEQIIDNKFILNAQEEVINIYAQWGENQYIVTFNSNGGDGEVDMLLVYFDNEFTLSKNNFTRTGYTFKGWSATATGTVEYEDEQVVKNLTTVKGGKVDLFAVWEANKYTVKFNANKPSNASASVVGEMNNLTCVYDVEGKLTANTYNLDNWTFKGWSTTATGTVEYEDEQEFINLTAIPDETINLYAVWKKNTTTIIYDANGGVGNMSNSLYIYDNDSENELILNSYVKNGYDFKGWATDPTSNFVYSDGQKLINEYFENEAVTLYAVWEVNVETIGKCDGIATGAVVSDSYNNGKTYTVYKTIASTPRSTNLFSDRVIIDWSKETNLDISAHGVADHVGRTDHIDIGNNVKELVLVGESSKTFKNLQIVFCEFTNNHTINIRLFNFNLESNYNNTFECYNTDSVDAGINLVVETNGDCKFSKVEHTYTGNVFDGMDYLTFKGTGNLTLQGGNAGNANNNGGSCIVNSNTVTVDMEGTLTIKGGNGGAGISAGGNGSNGGVAVSCTNFNVLKVNKLTVEGGSGGKGIAGSNGADGSGNDSPGKDGSNGGNGGHGASAIVCTNITISTSCQVYLVAGDGGAGGKGGNGGNGTDDDAPASAKNGKGGNGGNGGDGGSCATPIISTNATINSSITYDYGTVGAGGVGGNGGNGGDTNGWFGGDGSAGGKGGTGGLNGDGVTRAANGTDGKQGA